LNYNKSDRLGLGSDQLYQEYNVTSQDDIFGGNQLRLDLRWDRIVDYNIGTAVDRPVLRALLEGTAYDFMIRYTPLQYTSPSGRLFGSKLEGLQATWRFLHDGLPELRMEYREDKRQQATLFSGTISSVARMRLAELDHSVGGLRFGASYRKTNNSASTSSNSDREAGTGTLRAAFDKAILPQLRINIGADVQRSEIAQGVAPNTTSRTRNVRGSVLWRAMNRLQVGFNAIHRESLAEGGGLTSLLDVNRTFTARAVFTPTEEVDLSLQRDIRDNNRPSGDVFYDVVRMRIVYAGLLSSGLRARLTGMKHVTIKTENTRTPADATDITLHFQLYRRTEARVSLTYNRQQHQDSGYLSRHALNKVVEVKSRLSRRLLARFDYRGGQTSSAFEFFEIDSHNYSANLNYTNSGGFSLSGNVRRSLLVEGERVSQMFYGLNMSGRLTENLGFTLDGTWTKHSAADLSAPASSYNARLQYQLSKSAFVAASYQTSDQSGVLSDETFNASFQINF